jgi:hypothetical protein
MTSADLVSALVLFFVRSRQMIDRFLSLGANPHLSRALRNRRPAAAHLRQHKEMHLLQYGGQAGTKRLHLLETNKYQALHLLMLTPAKRIGDWQFSICD